MAIQRKPRIDPAVINDLLRRLNPILPPAREVMAGEVPAPPMAPPLTRGPVDVGAPPDPYGLSAMEAVPRVADYQTDYRLDYPNVDPNNELPTPNLIRRAAAVPDPRHLGAPSEVAPAPEYTGAPPPVVMPPMYRSKLEALRGSDPSSRVSQVDGGYDAAPPEKMSRWKALGLGALRGFGMGGLGGAAMGAGIGAVSPNTIQNLQRSEQIGQAEGEQGRQIALQRGEIQNQTQGIENQERASVTAKRNADLINGPALERQKRLDADYMATTDNLRQLRPNTEPAEFQRIKRAEESRLGRPIHLPAYSRQDAPTTSNEFTLPPGGVRYRKNADGTVSVVAERPERPLPANTDEVGRRQAELSSARTRLSQAQTAATAYEKQLAALDAAAAAIPTYAQLVVEDDKGLPKLATSGDEKSIVYDTKTKSPERVQYEKAREDLQRKLEAATKERNDANTDLEKVYVPEARTGQQPLTRQPTTPYTGRTMSEANLERYAKDEGLSVEEARKKIEAQGVRVQ